MKNILSALLLACICTFALACKTGKCIENPKPDCVCTMQYDPVCGCNNKTYSNACAAQCAGITKFKKGECPTDD